jgi:hypothetical protein
MSRLPLALAALIGAAVAARAADPPLVEPYLHSGQLAKGEQVLERAIEGKPKDDQARFGLGVVRVVRAVERLGQSLHEFGVKPDSTSLPFLRLPVPENKDPTPISYATLRRVLERFGDDLAKAEATLADVKDDGVKLPLRLADVTMDLDGDGKPTDKLVPLLKKLLGVSRFEFLEKNADFRVTFDRGDVAWLRAYCHLLSAMLDFSLGFDLKPVFDAFGKEQFAKPKTSSDDGNAVILKLFARIDIPEPARLGSFRRHMLKVCELNVETWKYIRAEKDDDHEWLPNPKQKGVLGLPVTDAMIDGWLAGVAEMEGLFGGKKVIDLGGLVKTDGHGLNFKEFLDHPPESISISKILSDGVDKKYLTKMTADNTFNNDTFGRMLGLFDESFGFAYGLWFN